MPKKRHQAKYSKPPTTAPASLSLSSSSRSQSAGNNERSVNNLLANLRRTSLNRNGQQQHVSYPQNAPSVPPELRRIFHIPDTPAPPPRRPQRHPRLQNGRRIPPGPPPPRSWISLSGTSRGARDDRNENETRLMRWRLPGVFTPDERSLINLTLVRLAEDWEQQRDWNRFYLYKLPSRHRAALLALLSETYGQGVTAQDLELVLAGPPKEELDEYAVEAVDFTKWNTDLFWLDLSGSIGKSLSLKDLMDLILTPRDAGPSDSQPAAIQDSWDAPDPTSGPAFLLPNLTHLSLAVDPSTTPNVSWKQLLSLASKWPSLTHLSLAGWPEPSLTPNAKYAKMVSPATGQSVQYGGTGPYSHNLDDDWFEATMVLRRLSRTLYKLEYLDLTGCAEWWRALFFDSSSASSSDEQAAGSGAMVLDWAGDWGKVTTLRLSSGYAIAQDSSAEQAARYTGWIETAKQVEQHIQAQRGGRGRFITVERDRADR